MDLVDGTSISTNTDNFGTIRVFILNYIDASLTRSHICSAGWLALTGLLGMMLCAPVGRDGSQSNIRNIERDSAIGIILIKCEL